MRQQNAQRHAISLRKSATATERHLWRFLRNRQLAGFRFRRQVPIGNYIADFACVEGKVVIEVDGGQHLTQQKYDARRDRELAERGYQVMRFWDNDVLLNTESVLVVILQALERPHPVLPPQAGAGTC
jgi:very-short-patch-repair endonuclease